MGKGAISELDNVAQTPAPNTEIFISFSFKGDEEGLEVTIDLTFTF
jgi:hypothetical protein